MGFVFLWFRHSFGAFFVLELSYEKLENKVHATFPLPAGYASLVRFENHVNFLAGRLK